MNPARKIRNMGTAKSTLTLFMWAWAQCLPFEHLIKQPDHSKKETRRLDYIYPKLNLSFLLDDSKPDVNAIACLFFVVD